MWRLAIKSFAEESERFLASLACTLVVTNTRLRYVGLCWIDRSLGCFIFANLDSLYSECQKRLALHRSWEAPVVGLRSSDGRLKKGFHAETGVTHIADRLVRACIRRMRRNYKIEWRHMLLLNHKDNRTCFSNVSGRNVEASR